MIRLLLLFGNSLFGLLLTVPAGARDAAPGKMPQLERELRQTLSKHISPLRQLKVTPAEMKLIKSALRDARTKKPEEARAKIAQILTPSARKLVEWQILRSGGADKPEDYATFLEQNPNWPGDTLLRKRMERTLIRAGFDAKRVIAITRRYPPLSGDGHVANAIATLQSGKTKSAHDMIAKAWCFERFSREAEDRLLEVFGKALTAKDHKCRLDRLLVSNPRSRAIRRSRIRAANRLLPLLGKRERTKAVARLKVYGAKQKCHRAIASNRCQAITNQRRLGFRLSTNSPRATRQTV